MKNFFVSCLFVLTFLSCTTKEERIVKEKDIEAYLRKATNAALVTCNSDIHFWTSRDRSSTSLLKIASLYSSRFKITGEVADLYKSDSLYLYVLSNGTEDEPALYQALASNAITQHQFKKAKAYIEKALAIGDKVDASLLMLADIDGELGYYDLAKRTLLKFRNKHSFAYLIRAAKLKDHEGDLDSAIVLMETALERVKGNRDLFCWTKSNLGDMYGHAGKIKEAYEAYLDVLERDPDYEYALKGIAWIAFSHDMDFELARDILLHLLSVKSIPDYHLFLAEIAEAEGNSREKEKRFHLFTNEASDLAYGRMYTTYLAQLEAEEFARPYKAITIALEEISNRPCPKAYDLLAWSYYHAGENVKALEIAKRYVDGKTHEPDALFHTGMIYKLNGLVEESEKLLKLARESSFELGPNITLRIDRELQSLE